MSNQDEVLDAAEAVERAPGTAGMSVIVANTMNVASFQVALNLLRNDFSVVGIDASRSQVITNAAGQPLLYLVDTRDWPEQLEHKLFRLVPLFKVGRVPQVMSGVKFQPLGHNQ